MSRDQVDIASSLALHRLEVFLTDDGSFEATCRYPECDWDDISASLDDVVADWLIHRTETH